MDATTLLLASVATAVLIVVALKQLLASSPTRLPPVSSGLPPIGEALRLISKRKLPIILDVFSERMAQRGAMVTTHVLGERAVVSADPAFNRLLLNGEGRIADSGYPSTVTTLLGANAVLVTHGPAHKGLHSLALARLGHTTLPRVLAHADRLVRATMRRWETPAAAAAIRLVDEARKITMDLNIRHLFSIEPGTWSDRLRLEFNAINDGFTSIPFPLTFLLPFTKYAQALKARKNVALALEEVIRKRMDDKVMKDGGKEGENQEIREKDIVDLLLEADGGSFSMEQKVDFCLNLLAAGYDTTSLTMALAVKFLTETPTALAQLREEHDNIRKRKGGNQSLEWSNYQSMAFTQCVINETLRVSNIVAGVFRRASTDIHFKDYIIPKGCKIIASFRAVHLNSENYENARTFHTLGDGSTNKLQDAPGANLFTPFGGGPRQCPGNELARVVVSVFLHHLVTRFGWEESEEDKLVLFPTPRTLKGYPINLQRRPDIVC